MFPQTYHLESVVHIARRAAVLWIIWIFGSCFTEHNETPANRATSVFEWPAFNKISTSCRFSMPNILLPPPPGLQPGKAWGRVSTSHRYCWMAQNFRNAEGQNFRNLQKGSATRYFQVLGWRTSPSPSLRAGVGAASCKVDKGERLALLTSCKAVSSYYSKAPTLFIRVFPSYAVQDVAMTFRPGCLNLSSRAGLPSCESP